MLGNFVVCHLITTGRDPIKDEIIAIALVKINNLEIIETTHYLSKPSCRLPVRVKTITGLNDQSFEHKPYFNELIPEIFNFIGDAALVSYEADLVYTFLSAAVGHPLPTLCLDVLQLAKILLPTVNNYRLDTLYENLFSTTLTGSGVDDTALTVAEIFLKLCAYFKELDPKLLTQLSNILNRTIENSLINFIKTLTINAVKNYSFHTITDSNNGTLSNDYLHEDSQSLFYEHNEDSEENYPSPLNQKQIIEILGPGGELAQSHPHYEYRPQQLTMAEAVTEALNKESVLLTEAGTGTGKSMAYLIPAVLWAVQNKKRVVVSTHTINLQEQLWFKDIPLLKNILSVPFRAALIKGRQNYLCLRRWSEFLSITDSRNSQEALFCSRILIWLTKTQTGDRSELNLNGAEYDQWLKISADSDNCNGPQCRWFHRTCFVNRAKKLAENSDLIIINHSLLCSDMQIDNRILPAFGPLIIDEAHHLENVATDHFGYMVSWMAIILWLNTTEKLLQKLSQAATGTEDGTWDQFIYTTRKAREDTYRAVEIFFKLLKTDPGSPNVPGKTTPGANVKRLYKDNNPSKVDWTAEQDNLLLSFKILITGLRKLLLKIEAWAAQYERWVNMGKNLSLHLNLGTQLLTNIDFILSHQDPNFVYWMETLYFSTNSNITLRAAPIAIGKLLHEKLFTQRKTVIMTSATLTIEGIFDYFKERTGLNLYTQEIRQLQIESPFNYSKQAKLYLASDLPNQNEVPEQFYYFTLANIIEKLVSLTQGKSLVLFTSHYALKETYMRLKSVLEEMDILLLGHNIDGSRSGLIEEFTNNRKSVLFGTASFWEGIDISGENLSLVIIVKLPFWAPGVPIIEARLEQLAQQGKSGFWEFSLPQAVIRFKQGFGRLIRSSRDHGAVIVLDKRIMQKKYGRHFLNSLPLKHHQRGSIDNMLSKLSQWLEFSKR